MSSTNRGGQRSASDNYPTPAWCVHRLMEMDILPETGSWLEPCAGDGAIIRAIGPTKRAWYACDIRPECAPLLQELPVSGVAIADFTTHNPYAGKRFNVAITNPPFSLAGRVINQCMSVADTVVMLLRLNFLASVERAAFMRERTPDVYVLPNRPSFRADGKTDSIEYAWFVWRAVQTPGMGRVSVLATTPKSERKRKD